jgi:hypothetical protein
MQLHSLADVLIEQPDKIRDGRFGKMSLCP